LELDLECALVEPAGLDASEVAGVCVGAGLECEAEAGSELGEAVDFGVGDLSEDRISAEGTAGGSEDDELFACPLEGAGEDGA
jgi:hypothetical protein